MENSNSICKLQQFVAHKDKVNCLVLGQNSGGVLATAGSDNNVNLWKVDSKTCFMSLCGHVTPIECVQFDTSEYLIAAGSHTGSLKVWDLSKGKTIKTFSGHKRAITKLDFFPFSSSTYFITGSKDTSIKLWDCRSSHCIGMYRDHDSSITSLKYSPDGLWIASGDENGTIKIWDLRIVRMIHVFDNLHKGAVTSIQFHPFVFILATSGTDGKISILDLEHFSLISQIDTEKSIIRCLQFSDDGHFLYGGSKNFLGVYSVEPTKVCDSIYIQWNDVNDFVIKGNKIIGASYLLSEVSTWLINLPEEYPIKNQFSPPDIKIPSLKVNTMLTRDSGVRKSFNKSKSHEVIKPKPNMKSINEILNENNQILTNDIPDCQSAFIPNRTLNRSPIISQNSEDDNLNAVFISDVNKIQSNKYIVENVERLKEEKHGFDNFQGIILSSYSDTETTSTDSTQNNSFQLSQLDNYNISDYSEKLHNSNISSSISMRNVSPSITNENISIRHSSLPVYKQNDNFSYNKKVSPQYQRENYPIEFILPKRKMDVEKQFEHPLEDFDEFKNSLSTIISNEEISLEFLFQNHKFTMDVLQTRQRNLNIIQTLWRNKNFKAALNSAISTNDNGVIVDLINIIIHCPSLWCLDVCSLTLPKIYSMIQSENEFYINVSFRAIKDILQYFMPVIKNNIQRPPSAIDIDITREERYNKCQKCYNTLLNIKLFVLKRQTVSGNLGNIFRQLHMILQTIDL